MILRGSVVVYWAAQAVVLLSCSGPEAVDREGSPSPSNSAPWVAPPMASGPLPKPGATLEAGLVPPPEGVDCDSSKSLGPVRVWRLSDQQYVNVVRDIFGVKLAAEVTEVALAGGEYSNLSELARVTPSATFAYQGAARIAASAAVQRHAERFFPCDLEAPPTTCVDAFIRNRVARAFGRPLTDVEAKELVALYDVGAQESPRVGLRMLIEATLQSASFLYRTEIGLPVADGPSGRVTLTTYELAEALSFALLDSVPDNTLWEKAADGTLAAPEVWAAEVDRLLETPAVQANLAQKAGYWLPVERILRTEKGHSALSGVHRRTEGKPAPQRSGVRQRGDVRRQSVRLVGLVSSLCRPADL